MPHFDVQPFLDRGEIIETSSRLREFLDEAAKQDIFAVDTESAGFYKYRSVVNLVQVCTRKSAAIIDPQKIKDFSPLREFAEKVEIEWVFHGGDYDAHVLFRDFGIRVRKLFDTRLAAEILSLKELGLSALAEKYLGFPLDKRLQRCDWSKRPLTSAMKKYALLDAICLVPLRDVLFSELKGKGRLEWAMEEFRDLSLRGLEQKPHVANPFAFMIKGANALPLRALMVLKEIWTLRDEIARNLDRAPFLLLNNFALLEIAKKAPQTLTGLSVIKGVSENFLLRFGSRFLEAIRRGLETDPAKFRLPEKPRVFQNALSGWEGQIFGMLRHIRNAVGTRVQIPPSLLASDHALEGLSHLRPQTLDDLKKSGMLKSWQFELLGEEFLSVFTLPLPKGSKKNCRRRKRRLSK